MCVDQSQYKPYKTKKGLGYTPSKKKKGMGFEEDVGKRHDQYMAQRMVQSGGIYGFEGDVSLEEVLIECKERSTEGAEKSIRIKKEWLDKIIEESKMHEKFPGLAFRYKEYEDDIYFVMEFDFFLELLFLYRDYKNKYEKLKSKQEVS